MKRSTQRAIFYNHVIQYNDIYTVFKDESKN